MYIKLGNSSINYPKVDHDDFMIFGQVVNSPMSYEKPILVRTAKALEVWFGKDFPDYEYLCELLSSGCTLYLYKPISTSPNDKFSGYIDYESFPESELIDQYKINIDEMEEGIIYRIMEDDGYYHDELVRWNKYVLIDNVLVNIRDLPQNIDNINSQSMLNRDTLRLMHTDYEYPNLPYCYNKTWEEDIITKPEITRVEEINLEKINAGYQTLAFDVEYLTAVPTEDSYIILPRKSDGKGVLFYFVNKPEEPELGRDYVGSVKVTSMNDLLLRAVQDFGYTFNKAKSILTASFPVPVTYFYDIPHFKLTPNLVETHNILSDFTDGQARIEFVSKTIGNGGYKGDIEVQIENTGDNYYRVTISRFDYSEVHEGYLYDDNPNVSGDERIDHEITKNSNLVRCNIINQWTDPTTGEDYLYSKENDNIRKSELPVGKWKMGRGTKDEVITKEMYRRALLEMVTTDNDPVYPDFILIPDLDSYGPKDFGPILLEDLEMANSQALVVNNENNYTYNQVGDINNRIVYFYKDMTIRGHDRPGYYLYIQGLLFNNYSMSSKDLLYYGPVTASSSTDPYETSKEDLEKHKCNYLIDNGHMYYYKCFFDGEGYYTTGWMRFVLGKVTRELEKNKWEYLGKRMVGQMKNSLETILGNITNTFSIVREITITDFNVDIQNNKLDLTIYTEISDLVKSNITVDIVINYNKN